MDDTPNLNLPYIMPAQAQKHVTHNEAIRALDALVQLSVLDRDLAGPPGSPVDGDRYVVAAVATDDWSGKENQIAAWQDNAWTFFVPAEGWLAWIADEDVLLVWDGAGWVLSSASLNPAPLVGVNTNADAANRLAVSSPNSLFTHEGDDHRLKINKAALADTASFLFQSNFSGRAEIGTTGDDDFHFKVSPDGSVWFEALTIDASNGFVGFGTTSPSTNLHVDGPLRVGGYTVATVPSAATSGAGAQIYVSDETGGAVLAFSDGTDWRRVTDRAVVS